MEQNLNIRRKVKTQEIKFSSILDKELRHVSFEFQGSVMTKTHTKGYSDIDLLAICEKFYGYDSSNVKKVLSERQYRNRYRASLQFNFGILIGIQDDKVVYRDKDVMQPRDNILFMGRLGVSKCALLVDKEIKVLSDVEGNIFSQIRKW